MKKEMKNWLRSSIVLALAAGAAVGEGFFAALAAGLPLPGLAPGLP